MRAPALTGISGWLLGYALAACVVLTLANEVTLFRRAAGWIQLLVVVAFSVPLAFGLARVLWPRIERWIAGQGPIGSRRGLFGIAALSALLLVAVPTRGAPAVVLAQWGCLTAVLLVVTTWLLRWDREPGPVRAWEGWGHATLPVASWLFWLWALAPGLLSSDSADQWIQAGHGRLLDYHPIMHTLLLRGVRQVWDSPAGVGLLQILSMGALVGWGLRELRLSGLGRAGAWVSAALLALLPVFSTHAITVWKDVPYGIALLGITTVLFRLASGRPVRPSQWVLLVVFTAMAWLVRHNGAPVLLGVFVALVLLLPRGRRATSIWVAVAVVLLAVGSKHRVKQAYAAPDFTKELALVGFLGAHVAHGTPLSADEAAILEDIHPLSSRWNYSCLSNVPTVWGGQFDSAALDRHAPGLSRLTARLTLRNPWPVLKHIRCASSLLWEIRPQKAPALGTAMYFHGKKLETIYEAPGSPTPAFPSPSLAEGLARFVERTLSPSASWLIWRPALALWVLLLGCALACWRAGSPRALFVLAPAAVHTAALALVIPNPDVRYQFGVTLIAAVLGVGFWGGAKIPPAVAASDAEAPAGPDGLPDSTQEQERRLA